MGAVGCLSFYPTKTLGALGDAGMCLTGDADLGERIRRLRHHGQTDAYRHAYVGGNFRMDAMQAAALRVKLAHLDKYLARRGELACRYHELLADTPVQTPGVAEYQHHAFNYYTIRAPRRDELRQYLTDRRIGCSVFYPLPLHLQPCFAALGGKTGDHPLAEQAANQVLSLPIYPTLDDARQMEVAEAIRSFYHQ
jgi:dTDP-4-amino-4,6-dideoxygalactose transaminase